MRMAARPSGPLKGRIKPPGDKSISHRALLFAAMAKGRTQIDGLLEGDDVLRTAGAMQAFGADVLREGAGRWRVDGLGPNGFKEPTAPVDFGNSGTGVRLTMGAAAGYPISVVYTGDKSLSGRPMARILKPLEAMGAKTMSRTGGLLPAMVQGGGLRGVTYQSPHASAQIKSAVLLAGLHGAGPTHLTEPRQSRDHTERMLSAFGAEIASHIDADGACTVSVRPGGVLEGRPVFVPGDPSSAAFALVAASIVAGSDVIIEDIGLNPLRTGLFETAKEMGASISVLDEGVSSGETMGMLRVRAAEALRAARPPESRAPSMIDEFPILAVLAAFADGETVLSGAAELRVKESDRIALTAEGLRACGVPCEERPDGLVIQGQGLRGVKGGASVRTHGDHRIAMSFLVLGLAAQQGVVVDEAEMIATSFPDFGGFMRKLGAPVAQLED